MADHLTEIEEAEYARCAAMLHSDAPALTDLLHDHLKFGHSNAERDDKSSLLSKIEHGDIVYSRIEHTVDDVARVGDVAVAIGTLSESLTMDGKPLELHNNTLSTWVHGSRWQLLAFQQTPLPKN